jgi:hypothetical protein
MHDRKSSCGCVVSRVCGHAEDQISAAAAARTLRSARLPNGVTAPASIPSVIVTPRKPSLWRSSPWMTIGESPAGSCGSRAGYVAHESTQTPKQVLPTSPSAYSHGSITFKLDYNAAYNTFFWTGG